MLFDDVSDVDSQQQFSLKVLRLKIFWYLLLWESVSLQADEKLFNICFHKLSIWQVQPYNLSVSISSSVLGIAIVDRH